MPSMDALIELDGVEKVFDTFRRAGLLRREKKQVRAVDGITFTVARGRWWATSGPMARGSRRRSRC